MRLLLAALVVVISGVGAGAARADKPDVSLAGKPFYFSATCTGLGDIVLVNQSLARTAALRVVGSRTVVVEPLNGAPGVERVANAECTITGGGFSPETIEPFDEPFWPPAFRISEAVGRELPAPRRAGSWGFRDERLCGSWIPTGIRA
jgi:hypothetical protein